MDRYEVPWEVCLSGFGIGMSNDDFHISGIWHVLTDSLKMKSIPQVQDASGIMAK